MNSFIISYYFSISIQIIAFFIQLYGYLLPTTKSIITLKYALNIEFFVSIIELIVYAWIGTNLMNLNHVMNKRYLDWVITTNFLLISIALLFMYYNENALKIKEEDKNVKGLIQDNIPKFAPILLFNNLMLFIGFMGEKKKIKKIYSFSFGFLCFFASFYYLYTYFGKFSHLSKRVFYIIAFIWGLYGVAHLMKDKLKNTMYNLLDLISKNFFGIFLVYFILDQTN